MDKEDSKEYDLVPVVSGMLVLFLQLGVQLVEAGSVRIKNVSSVFTRGLACLSLSLLTFWVCGYALALSPGHYFLGYTSLFGLDSASKVQYANWFLHASVASLPSAIVAESVSERSHLTGHLVLATLTAGLIFPLPAHWVWQDDGWLKIAGCQDVGGVLTVHLLSGIMGLVATLLVGQRVEKIGDKFHIPIQGHSLPLVAIGGMLVLIGMVGKSVGLGATIGQDIGVIAVNLLLAGSGGGVLAVNLSKIAVTSGTRYELQSESSCEAKKQMKVENKRWSYMTTYNGFLAGMISVCGCGSSLPSWAAFLAGLAGGLFYFLLSGLLKILKIDDTVNGVAVHLGGGLWGVMVTGFARLPVTKDGMIMAWQLMGAGAVSAWVTVCSLIVMLPLLLCGKLRIREKQERLGIDIVKIQEIAYVGVQDNCEVDNGLEGIKRPTNTLINTRETLPRYAYVSPNIRDQVSTSRRRLISIPMTDLEENEEVASCPSIIVEVSSFKSIPSPPPPPPPYSTSLSNSRTNLAAPEIAVIDADISSVVDYTNDISNKPMAMDIAELRVALRQQKERLRDMNTKVKSSPIYPGKNGNYLSVLRSEEDSMSLGGMSNISINSGVVRLAAQAASNKVNFNYLAGHTPDVDLGQSDNVGINKDHKNEEDRNVEIKNKYNPHAENLETINSDWDDDKNTDAIDDDRIDIENTNFKSEDVHATPVEHQDENNCDMYSKQKSGDKTEDDK